jgi:hypothetical protein
MKKLFVYIIIILLLAFSTPSAFAYAISSSAKGSVYTTTSCQSEDECITAYGAGSTCDMTNVDASGYGTCLTPLGSGGTGGGTTVTPATPAAQSSTASSNCNLSYQALEPIPGVTTNLTDPNSLPAIINAIFTVLITVGALMAVLMLTIGGIQYMVSGGPVEKNKGIKRAQAALWGIVLIAGSWLILHTINPALLNFSLNSVQPSSTNCGTAATPTTPAPTTQSTTNSGSASSLTLSNNQLSTDQQAAVKAEGTPVPGVGVFEFDPNAIDNASAQNLDNFINSCKNAGGNPIAVDSSSFGLLNTSKQSSPTLLGNLVTDACIQN